jgi:hypothetical protein
MKNEVLENLKEWMQLLEHAITNDEAPSDFEKTFCYGNMMFDIAFTSATFIVWFTKSSGETLTETYSINELEAWLEK